MVVLVEDKAELGKTFISNKRPQFVAAIAGKLFLKIYPGSSYLLHFKTIKKIFYRLFKPVQIQKLFVSAAIASYGLGTVAAW